MGIMSLENYTDVVNATCPFMAYGVRFLEPVPEWQSAKESWGIAWPLHNYGMGTLFAMLLLVSIMQNINAIVQKEVRKRMLCYMLNIIVLLATTTQATGLFVDAYGSFCRLSRAASYVLLHLITPCVASSFIILLVLLLRLSKLQLVLGSAIHPGVVAGIIFFNLALGITADLVSAYYTRGSLFLTICYMYFIILGLLTSASFLYVFARFYKRIVINRKNINQMSKESGGSSRSRQHALPTTLPLVVKIALAATLIFFIICIINIFYLIAMWMRFRCTEKNIYFEGQVIVQYFFLPWFWFIYHTTMRACDLLLLSLISIVVHLNLCKNMALTSRL